MSDTEKKPGKKSVFVGLDKKIKEAKAKHAAFMKRITPTKKDLSIVFNI